MKIGNYRAPFINYHLPGIFMITINKRPGIPDFSKINFDIEEVSSRYDKALQPSYSRQGFAIYHSLKDFKSICPDIETVQYKIMPDHIHFIVNILNEIELPLGNYIAAFKHRVSQALSESQSIFEEGFNDQFLKRNRSLKVMVDYIRSNPYNLWVRHKKPQYFTRVVDIPIDSHPCSLYGNVNLLVNPFITPVVIHRRDTPEQLERKKQLWRYTMANGGVLASPFISPAEKEIFHGAASFGGRLILLQNRPFENREKPSGKLFDLCANGQLLIIAPHECSGANRPSRHECLFMNALAESISTGTQGPSRLQ